LLLLSVCFGATTTRFFLPTSWRLILKLPSYDTLSDYKENISTSNLCKL
jgi:hypothetical protein